MRYKPRQELTIDFWPSFADALLSVILVLLFVVTVFVAMQTGLVSTLSSREKALALLSERLGALERSLTLSQEEAGRLRNELGRTEKTLSATFEALTATRGEVEAVRTEEEAQRADAQARLAHIQDLTRKIEEYMAQMRALNEQLAQSKKDLGAKDASLKDLNASVKGMGERVALLNSQLGEAKRTVESKELELTKLLDELESRNVEIQRLKRFERYKSEFLARLAGVFSGVENIRVAGDRFVFQSEVLFSSGSADLTETGKQKLDTLYETYKSLESKIPGDVGFNIQIQGHTDADPIVHANFASNWELSTARATAVVKYLTKKGVPSDQLSSAGYSQYYPAAPGSSAEAKRQNRRIEIFFTRR